ncbi:MAG: ABC transporter substrate-binding protein [Deltaproteobacteria bacterium]|nr:ABC transporter substrate-binding protein [Deltaproteobacteria bacterium]
MGARCCCVTATFLLLLSVSPPALAQGKAEKERIRIGYSVPAAVFSIPFVAGEAGLFREEGLQIEFIRTPGSLAPMVLISEDVDFSIMSAFLLIPASVRRGGDPVMLGGFSTHFGGRVLVSRPEIRSAKELRGKLVGIQRPGDAVEKMARFALQHLGLDPDKDVTFNYLGSDDVLWPALETNRVSATMISPPRTVAARRAGMNFLVNIADLNIEYQGAALTSRRSFMSKYPNLAFRTVRALVRGVHFFKTRREETMGILGTFYRTKDREALEETWDYYAPVLPAKPYVLDNAVQAVLRHLTETDARYAQRKPAEFIDSGYLSELDRSGYIDRLYGGARVRGK